MDRFDPRSCAVTNLRTAARVLTRAYDAKMGHSGILSTQFPIMTFVDMRGSCTISELASYFSMDPSTATRNIRPLIASGALRMKSDSADSRRKNLSLTVKGRKMLETATREWRGEQSAVVDKLGEERFAQLIALLGDLR